MYRFLVVEDDDTIQLVIKRLLTKHFQCEISTAKNGLEALKKLEIELPDLVLLDVSMPVMNGIETLQAIRGNERIADLPVIILTAMNDKASVSNLVTKGISDYLLKPINFSTAPARIKHVLNQARLSKNESKGIDHYDSKKDSILLIDKDPAFRQSVHSMLFENFNVIEAPNCVEGLTIYIERKPQYILVTEKQEILNEKILAQKVKNNPEKNFKGIFLLREEMLKDNVVQTYFNGAIKKTKVRHQFIRYFNEALFDKVDNYILIKEIFKDNIAEKLLHFIQQKLRENDRIELPANIERDFLYSNWKRDSISSLIEADSKTRLLIQLFIEKDISLDNLDGTTISYKDLLTLISDCTQEKLIQIFNEADLFLNKTENREVDEKRNSRNSTEINISFTGEANNNIGLSIGYENAV
jgi:CheY-like chemotaxis protein